MYFLNLGVKVLNFPLIIPAEMKTHLYLEMCLVSVETDGMINSYITALLLEIARRQNEGSTLSSWVTDHIVSSARISRSASDDGGKLLWWEAIEAIPNKGAVCFTEKLTSGKNLAWVETTRKRVSWPPCCLCAGPGTQRLIAHWPADKWNNERGLCHMTISWRGGPQNTAESNIRPAAYCSCPLGRWVLKYRSFLFIFFPSPSRMCKLIGFSGLRDVFFFVASKFNSEMQAMFCGRILPSLYSFLVVAIFAKTECYSPSNLLVRSAMCRTSATYQLSTCRKWYVHHSKHSMIILVTKPISITPVLSLARKASEKSSRSKRSLKAKANHSLKICFRTNHLLGHEYTGSASLV